MRFIFATLLLFFIVGVVLSPMVLKEKKCYDGAARRTEEIQFNIPTRQWDISQVCEARTEVLMDLDVCVREATNSSRIAPYVTHVIEGAVSVFRPLTKQLPALIAQHNEECVDFFRYQLP